MARNIKKKSTTSLVIEEMPTIRKILHIDEIHKNWKGWQYTPFHCQLLLPLHFFIYARSSSQHNNIPQQTDTNIWDKPHKDWETRYKTVIIYRVEYLPRKSNRNSNY